MDSFRIFTESKADIKFLKDFIQEIFDKDLDSSNFDPIGSWSGYKSEGSIIASIQENHDNQKKTILIADADTSFALRLEEMTKDFKSYNIPANIFLFPNHAENGNLENLLAKIAVDTKAMECFLKYEECVAEYPKKLNDSRIYSYLDMLLHPKAIVNKIDLRKEEYRDYRNKKHWDLLHEYVNPLKKFLQPFLTE